MAGLFDRIAGVRMERGAGLLLIALAHTLAVPSRADAAELIMFEQPGCPFCEKFDAEIAPDYPESQAGRIAPLRRVNIHEDRTGGIDGIDPAVFTPTFVLVDDGREIGRLLGYPGRKYFYPEIEALLSGLKPPEEATIEFPDGRSPAGAP